jgi:hypothetical protein
MANPSCSLLFKSNPNFHIYGIRGSTRFMKRDSVRTTVDIPHSPLPEAETTSRCQGRSVRELILAGVRTVLLQGQRPLPEEGKIPADRFRRPESGM